MRIVQIVVANRVGREGPVKALLADYLERANRYTPTTLQVVATEAKLLELVEKLDGRARAVLLLADSRGKMLSSPQIADEIRTRRDGGAQTLVVAIGPADGWSAAPLARADVVVSLGNVTLPHELAAVVMAEQVYRALTILAGHPYHSGH